MAALIPTPVTLEDLIDDDSKINLFNDGIETQLVSPRTKGVEPITVLVTDDPLAPRLITSVCDSNVLNTISDSAADFVTLGVAVGDIVVAVATGESAAVTVVTDLNNLITGTTDLCPLGTEAYYIIAADDRSYWTQKFGGGEWKRAGYKNGNNKLVAYTLPVDTNSVVVHQVVYPWELTDIANYPTN